MWFASFLFLVFSAQPQTKEAVRWDGETWRIANGRDSSIAQCGFNTCVGLLELCERRYNPSLVSLELRPTRDGIKMGDLRRVLTAHGLEAVGRAEATPEELIHATRKHLAILIALPGQGSWQPGHYVFLISKGDKVFSVDTPFHRVHCSLFSQSGLVANRREFCIFNSDTNGTAVWYQRTYVALQILLQRDNYHFMY